MNKQNGLVIRPYRKSHRRFATDRELVYLKYYLTNIARLDSLADLDHQNWEKHIRRVLNDQENLALQHDLSNP